MAKIEASVQRISSEEDKADICVEIVLLLFPLGNVVPSYVFNTVIKCVKAHGNWSIYMHKTYEAIVASC